MGHRVQPLPWVVRDGPDIRRRGWPAERKVARGSSPDVGPGERQIRRVVIDGYRLLETLSAHRKRGDERPGRTERGPDLVEQHENAATARRSLVKDLPLENHLSHTSINLDDGNHIRRGGGDHLVDDML